MPRIPALAFALLLPALSAHAEPGMEIVWQDEFNGASLDLTKWTHEVNAWGGGNNELQFYTARTQNSFVSGGNLTIRARKETYTALDPTDNVVKTRDYTSARLNSRFKGDFLYGRMEARIRTPKGQGLWPAFWMLPTDYEYGGWAASGEIDILEMRGENPFEAVFSLHFGAPWPGNAYSSTASATPDLSLDFHRYAVEWEPGEIRWYFDGQLVRTETEWWSSAGAYPAPFDKRFHMLLNVAVGGNFVQNPPADADYFPQEMVVDWVRVSQLGQQRPYGAEPLALPARLEVEDYDRGGEGYAFSDTTGANQGGAYRPEEPVDLEPTTDDGGGANLAFVETDEWIEYSATLDEGGDLRVLVRAASDAGGGSATLRVRSPQRGAEYLLPLALPDTGGWQSWTTVDAGDLSLPAGGYILRLEIDGGEFNVNWIDFQRATSLPAESWQVY